MDVAACDACGSSRAPEILSEHSTSQGRVAYVRCTCGSMGVRLVTYDDAPRMIAVLDGPEGGR